jgi:hypothetical protein
MPGIYVSGGSGLGKSFFAEGLARALKLDYVDASVGNFLHLQDFEKLPFEIRQLALILFYREKFTNASFRALREKRNFVADRSMLDYFAWGDIPPYPMFSALLPTPDCLVLVPTPHIEWYVLHAEVFTRKALRQKAYAEKAKTLLQSAELSPTTLHRVSLHYEDQLTHWCKALDWTYYRPTLVPWTDYAMGGASFYNAWQANVKEYMHVSVD